MNVDSNDETAVGAGADDTQVVAAADDTEVVDTSTAEAATGNGLAWSLDDTVEYQAPGRWRSRLITVGLTALVMIAAVGVAAFGLHLLEHQHRTATATPSLAPSAAPASLPPAPPPPTQTIITTIQVAPPPPPEPKLEGADARFIAFLRNNDVGSVYANVSNSTAIANARLVCTDMLHGTGFQNVADNLGLSSAQLAWFVDTASANYCPQFGGNV